MTVNASVICGCPWKAVDYGPDLDSYRIKLENIVGLWTKGTALELHTPLELPI